MTRLSRTNAEHQAPPAQKKRPAGKRAARSEQYDTTTFPPQRLSTIRLKRIGNDGAEIWIDSNSEPYLLANLTKRTLGLQIMYGDWWDLSSSNAAFTLWAQQHYNMVLPNPERGRKLAEDFLIYTRGLKQLLATVV